MRKFLFLAVLIIFSQIALCQTKQYLRADSVYVQRDGGNGELILLNSTRDSSGGVLTNIGKGRTAFVKEPEDVRTLIDTTAFVDTAFTTSCNEEVYAYYKVNIPQFKGRKVRVKLDVWEIYTTCEEAFQFYSWDKSVGDLKIFFAVPYPDRPHTKWPFKLIVQTY